MGGRLGRLLISLGLVSEVGVYAALSRQVGLPLVHQDAFPKEKPAMPRLNTSFLLTNNLLPLGDAERADSLPLVFGEIPRLCFGLESEIASQLNVWFVEPSEPEEEVMGDQFGASEFIEHLRDMASEAPIIQRVNQILAQASDIHIETYEDKSVVSVRMDGEIYPVDEIASKDAPAIVLRIKILSQLDIAERRMPQDGRTKLRVHGKEMTCASPPCPLCSTNRWCCACWKRTSTGCRSKACISPRLH